MKESIKDELEAEIARKAMMQREIEMSVNMARARDQLQIFGSVYVTLVTILTAAKLSGRPVPHVAAIPVVAGGVMLGNIWDLAYGTKLIRVVKEAENILANERGRFVPPSQALFYGLYTDADRAVYASTGALYGIYWKPFLSVLSVVPIRVPKGQNRLPVDATQ